MQILFILCVSVSSHHSNVEQYCWVTDLDLLHTVIQIKNSATGTSEILMSDITDKVRDIANKNWTQS